MYLCIGFKIEHHGPGRFPVKKQTMATVNQIRKQIETAEKRLAKAEKNVAMYDARIDSAIARAAKATGHNVTRDNYNETVPSRSYFPVWYSIESNFDSKAENEKAVARETREIARLNEILAGMVQEQAETGLESILSALMANFREAWVAKMMVWYGEHYDYIAARKDAARARYIKARRIYDYMGFGGRYAKHPRIYRFVENAKNAAAEIISDDAARMDKTAYLAKMRKETVLNWSACVKKLAAKCAKFDMDETKVSASEPTVTEKGFECVLTDGKARLVYARMIWAAEYSELVRPHTRYIVTERTK